ncbi:5-dehydro-2-deoxygluconokinase [Microbacterium sp. W4I4]|uniref:PfkB family carbohydrate kinase n=1 Tax=Microbacterium sp. W4I4 TaxID=3042295 RepID=UPI00278B0214|nr:PfkB family carbohydrate kinase [Microbacterium sp. W4I4]MDQ0615023.1 5-dehydro-2-deoxygluconokinase [Microbacterium sp. W4I4]
MSLQLNRELDVVTAGRAVVDLYPAEDGRAPKDVVSYNQFLGGSPTNVAVAAARAGLRSAVVTRTGDDLFHDFLVGQLEGFGVDTRWVHAVPGRRTTLAVCDLQEPHEPGLTFFRDPQPPEESIDAEELSGAAASARILWITASGFASEQSAAAHIAALATADRVFLDLDYRRDFWASESALRDRLRPILSQVDAVIGNKHEVEIALGASGTPEHLAKELLSQGPRLAVVKGGQGGGARGSRRPDDRAAGVPRADGERARGR